MTHNYMLGPDGRTVVKMDDLYEWAFQFEHANRVVEQTTMGGLFISTVFLGTDHNFATPGHPPILFETMVFKDGPKRHDEVDCERCSTWEQAERQHAKYVAKAKAGDYDAASAAPAGGT
jgi:hypothetical protein